MINVCWYFFKLALALVLVGAVATSVYLYVRMDDEIRQYVEHQLAERFPQLRVSVGGARLVEGRGIAIYDLSLAPSHAVRTSEPLLAIDELMLVCDVSVASLMQGRPPVRRVEVKHPRLSVQRSESGRWNFDALAPLQPAGGPVPPIVVRGGVVSLSDAGNRPPLVLRDIELMVTPVERHAPSAAGGATTPQAAAPVEEATAAAGSSPPWPSLSVEGTAAAPGLKLLGFRAALDGAKRQYTAAVDIQRFQLNELIAAWIRPVLPPMARDTRLEAVVDGRVTLAGSADAATAPDFTARLTVAEGRLDDPRLPQPIADIGGRIAADATQLQIHDLRGQWNGATVAMSLNRNGWAARAPLALSARIENLPLDELLHRTLASAAQPPAGAGLPVANLLREQLEKYKPSGLIDATLQAVFDGERWKPAASIIGRQLAFESDKFAYRLTGGDGRIDFRPAEAGKPAQLDLNLYGVGGGQRLHIVGQVFDPRPAAAGWAQISGEGLEVDDRLIAACDRRIAEASRRPDCRVLASLKPAGKFNLAYWRISRPHAGAEPQTELRLDLTDVRINYDLFPYPLRDIRGVVTARGNQWNFTNLVSAGRRTITGEGSLVPGPAGHELRLRLTGANVPLDSTLFDALQPQPSAGPSAAQRAWLQLRPLGAVNLTADVHHRIGDVKPRISVVIEPLANCSIKPEFFSYLLEDVAGTISYRDGEVWLQQLKARHDGVALGANGYGLFNPDGSWRFRLTGLWSDAFAVRSDLLTALPPKLTRLIDQLRPTGSLRLHNSELDFRQTATPVPLLEAAWDVQLECHQTDLHCGIPLNHITGSLRLQGAYDGQRSFSEGELDLETLTYQDVQFTNVKGPLWFDEAECRLGKHATDRAGKPSRRLTSGVYGGSVASDAWVRFASLPQYGVEADFQGVDLTRLMVERFRASKPLPGKVDAAVLLRGEGPAIEPLVGEGAVRIRDANIYELPLLVRQLKLLRASVPDSTAFNECDVAFRIQGPHIYLDKINFLGDVVDLYGYGYAHFNRNVKLIFRPELGPRDYLLPSVKQIVSQTSQQVVQMYVDGTLDDPKVTTE
ncbi:MAG: hypothetical protein DCC67_19725, partial [Planctomycetota bacterium]